MLEKTIDLYKESFSGLRKEVWYLSIVLLVNRAGAMVIPFLTVYLTSQQGFTKTDAGLIVSAFGVGSVFGSYIGGWITDKFGFYNVQQFTLIGSGIMFWVLGMQDTFWEMAIAIFFLSMVTDAFRPANQTALAFYSRPDNRVRAYGLLRLAVNLGFSFGPLIGGILIGGLGYEWLFIVNGFSCLFAAVAFRVLLPPGRQEEGEEQGENVVTDGKSAYKNWPFIAFIFFTMIGAVAFLQFFSSLPIYLKESLSYSETYIGLLIGLNGIMIVIMEMPLVHKVGQRWRSLPVIFVGNLFTAISFALLLGAPMTAFFAFAFIFFTTIGEMLVSPFTTTFVSNHAPVARRGEYMGLLSIGWAGAFIIAPPAGLWWAENLGFPSLWIMVAVLAFISGAGVYSMRKWFPNTIVPTKEKENIIPSDEILDEHLAREVEI